MDFKHLIITGLFFLLSLVLPASVFAGQYGEIEVIRKVAVDKKIAHPDKETKGGQIVWVDNLFASEYRFQPGQIVKFKLWVTNTSSQDLENVKVKDTLPSILVLESGALEFEIKELRAGETYESDIITARVVSQDYLTQDITCVVNTVEVWAGDSYDKDTAQICVEKQDIEFKELPQAGPTENIMILMASLFLAGFGTLLYRKSY